MKYLDRYKARATCHLTSVQCTQYLWTRIPISEQCLVPVYPLLDNFSHYPYCLLTPDTEFSPEESLLSRSSYVVCRVLCKMKLWVFHPKIIKFKMARASTRLLCEAFNHLLDRQKASPAAQWLNTNINKSTKNSSQFKCTALPMAAMPWALHKYFLNSE